MPTLPLFVTVKYTLGLHKVPLVYADFASLPIKKKPLLSNSNPAPVVPAIKEAYFPPVFVLPTARVGVWAESPELNFSSATVPLNAFKVEFGVVVPMPTLPLPATVKYILGLPKVPLVYADFASLPIKKKPLLSNSNPAAVVPAISELNFPPVFVLPTDKAGVRASSPELNFNSAAVPLNAFRVEFGLVVPIPTLPPTSTRPAFSPSAQALVYNAIWLATAPPSPVMLEQPVVMRAPAP